MASASSSSTSILAKCSVLPFVKPKITVAGALHSLDDKATRLAALQDDLAGQGKELASAKVMRNCERSFHRSSRAHLASTVKPSTWKLCVTRALALSCATCELVPTGSSTRNRDSSCRLTPCQRQEVQERKDEQHLALAAELDKLQLEYQKCSRKVRARPLAGPSVGCAVQQLHSRVRCAAPA
jgi:hypothetical protein